MPNKRKPFSRAVRVPLLAALIILLLLLIYQNAAAVKNLGEGALSPPPEASDSALPVFAPYSVSSTNPYNLIKTTAIEPYDAEAGEYASAEAIGFTEPDGYSAAAGTLTFMGGSLRDGCEIGDSSGVHGTRVCLQEYHEGEHPAVSDGDRLHF
jgi:hypothetical protein